MHDKYDIRTADRKCIIENAKRQKQSGEVGNSEKICVPIPEESGWKTQAEWLWGAPVSENNYIIDNIPIYVYELALGDEVLTRSIDGAKEFVRVVKRGGHSTYRVLASSAISDPKIGKIIDKLLEMGCDWEQGNSIHAAIDVPPSVDVYAVFDLLADAHEKKILKFEQGHFGHPGSNPRDSIDD